MFTRISVDVIPPNRVDIFCNRHRKSSELSDKEFDAPHVKSEPRRFVPAAESKNQKPKHITNKTLPILHQTMGMSRYSDAFLALP